MYLSNQLCVTDSTDVIFFVVFKIFYFKFESLNLEEVHVFGSCV